MPQKKIRFGILGAARICRRGMIPGIQQSGVAELVAIASRNPKTAQAWSQEFHIPRHYGSYEQLLADPEIDAIYNPLPNELHRPWSLAAAAAGKHVLCEKPLGLDRVDAAALVAGCRQHGVLLMEAFMWRHHPRTHRVCQMLSAGELGELRLVKMDFSFDIDRSDWRLDPNRGGGPLYDLGCYAINAGRLFTAAEPIEFMAHAKRWTTGVDMTTSLALRFPGDVMLLADASFECPFRCRIELVGTKACLELPDGVLPAPQASLLIRRPGPDGLSQIETVTFPAAQQYAEQVKAFCASIAAGKLLAPCEDGLANMHALDAVRQVLAV